MAQTFLQTLGFQDPDLHNPKHDEIVIWLTEEVKTHAIALAADWYFKRSLLSLKSLGVVTDITDLKHYYKSEYSQLHEVEKLSDEQIKVFFGNCPVVDFRISKINLEKPIVKQGNYIVGFADLIADVEVMIPYPQWKAIHGFSWEYGEISINFLYEVKTQINSLGELLRQLNTYKEYYPAKKIVVVAPPTPLKKLIEDQGFGFLEYTK